MSNKSLIRDLKAGKNCCYEAAAVIEDQDKETDKLKYTLSTIASYWDDNFTQGELQGAMYDARCLALQALEGIER